MKRPLGRQMQMGHLALILLSMKLGVKAETGDDISLEDASATLNYLEPMQIKRKVSTN